MRWARNEMRWSNHSLHFIASLPHFPSRLARSTPLFAALSAPLLAFCPMLVRLSLAPKLAYTVPRITVFFNMPKSFEIARGTERINGECRRNQPLFLWLNFRRKFSSLGM
jgi:hypothetical protein